tara:strand:- start:261 stop:758 length:498 start_codon:yes stop_codon:yes gene_type:complete
MDFNKRKINKSFFLIFFLLIIILLVFFLKNHYEKNKTIVLDTITINLLTNVHPNLTWSFKPLKPKLIIKPGEVTTVEYMVENLGNEEGTGIATFQYFPKDYGIYINKINCFCYDAQRLEAKEKSKYVFVMFIDPKATKDSKTKNVKEITIQFTFFDYKEYKKAEN